jgi:hypothetical protein
MIELCERLGDAARLVGARKYDAVYVWQQEHSGKWMMTGNLCPSSAVWLCVELDVNTGAVITRSGCGKCKHGRQPSDYRRSLA